MPQLMPLVWVMSVLMFVFIMLMMIMMFYYKMYNAGYIKNMISDNSNSYKW